MTSAVTPVILERDGSTRSVQRLALGYGPGQISESQLQALIDAHPECLPIGDIDALYSGAISLCRELNTNAGPIDNLLITPSGLPVIVECKLWRNPQARREVVGQIIDYAKELTRWTSSDLQREVGRRVAHIGNPLIERLAASGHAVDEAQFNDSVTRNLRLGRFLLLIVGDGIQENVEAIADYLQRHSGLQFTLALIEMGIFELEAHRRIVVPRILMKTELIRRTVVELPTGFALADQFVDDEASAEDDQRQLAAERSDPTSRISFWSDFLAGLILDDPDVRKPKPGRAGWLTIPLPFPCPAAWLTIYRSEARYEVGVNIKFDADQAGQSLAAALQARWPDIIAELGGEASFEPLRNGRLLLGDSFRTRSWSEEAERQKAFLWLRARTNDFVNVIFPKLKLLIDEESE